MVPRKRRLVLIDLCISVYVSPLNSIDTYNRILLEQYKQTLKIIYCSESALLHFNSITQVHLHYRTDFVHVTSHLRHSEGNPRKKWVRSFAFAQTCVKRESAIDFYKFSFA